MNERWKLWDDEKESETSITRNVIFAEFVTGAESTPTGQYFLVISELRGDGGSSTSQHSPLSWGSSDRSLTGEYDEFIVHGLLTKIQENRNLASMKDAITLLQDAGLDGIDVTMTNLQWGEIKQPMGVYLRLGETLDIPQP